MTSLSLELSFPPDDGASTAGGMVFPSGSSELFGSEE
jgi:hypothetical protein